jgi:hypothetical protein
MVCGEGMVWPLVRGMAWAAAGARDGDVGGVGVEAGDRFDARDFLPAGGESGWRDVFAVAFGGKAVAYVFLNPGTRGGRSCCLRGGSRRS